MLKYNIMVRIADTVKVPWSTEQGVKFMKEVLRPAYLTAKRLGQNLIINLDGGYGYSPSFIRAVFEGIASETGDEWLRYVKIISDDEPSLIKKCHEHIDVGLLVYSYNNGKPKNYNIKTTTKMEVKMDKTNKKRNKKIAKIPKNTLYCYEVVSMDRSTGNKRVRYCDHFRIRGREGREYCKFLKAYLSIEDSCKDCGIGTGKDEDHA